MINKQEIFNKHKKMFEDNNCILLETEYKSTSLNWEFICSCGNKHKIKPADFKRGRRCIECGNKARKEKTIIPKEDIIQEFKNREETLIEIIREKDENDAILTYVKYLCPNKHEIYKYFTHFKNGHKCKVCGSVKRGDSNKHNKEYLINELKKYDFEYIGGYIGYSKKFLCKCLKCGKEKENFIVSIRKNKGCECRHIVLLGEEHYNFKPYLTAEHRKMQRNGTIGYQRWRREVLKKYFNSCLVCFSIDNLEVHHLNSFSIYKNKRTDINNGVPLCKRCHKEFHSMYGKEFVTKEDFYDFVYCKKSCISW